MYQLLESLKLKDGEIKNLNYHQKRINYSFAELFPESESFDLSKLISIPAKYISGTYKLRISYGKAPTKIEFVEYEYRKINSLKVVYDDSIDYHLKFEDRNKLNLLFSQRENCDDILIINKGFITDSFAANLLFFDGKYWFTPNKPLLKGTKRQLLLDQKVIQEKEIRFEDLKYFTKVGLVNAMIDFDEMPIIPISQIKL